MGVAFLFFILVMRPPYSDILLLNPAILGSGAQSVTTDRDTRRSDGSNEYKGVRQ